MKLLLFILLLLGSPLVHAQDSLAVSFSEEQDSLPRLRFVDRYENVFMTKVPTRHMFKLSLTFLPDYLVSVEKSGHENTQYDLGYEFKVLPSWSVGAEVGANGGWGSAGQLTGTLTAKLYSRWYYDMRRRISEGKSVNNFTGNFLAVVGERLWGTESLDYGVNKIGLEFGLQRRFFTQSRLEMGIGLFYQDYNRSENSFWTVYDVSKSSRFAITSRTSMGLAFGDWKRNKNQPFCEVLHCDDFVQEQWKLLWPRLHLSQSYSNGTVGLSYERKIKSSPFSVNTQVIADYMRVSTRDLPIPSGTKRVGYDLQFQSSIQLRYYVKQRRAIRRGTGGNNLAGLYVGPYMDHLFYHRENIFEEQTSKKHLGLGAGAGFQQTMFKKAYVDLSFNMSHNLLKVTEDSKRYLGTIKMGFGLIF
jgi:hypothetical protein